MPSQGEIEYWKRRKQKMSRERLFVANGLALLTHTITQPMDLIKMRSLMLQEGKTFNGLGFDRGYNPLQLYREIHKQGGGYKIWFSNYEGYLARTIVHTSSRLWAYLYFYNRLNKDPRRHARPDRQAMAGLWGGLLAGIVSNPVELVYTRMQVDDLYKKEARRNYKSFYDGFLKASEEGALFDGCIANGLRIAGLVTAATNMHDFIKENMYYYLGPIPLNRLVSTVAACGIITGLSMPFDTVRVRMYTQKQLPNGKWPYNNLLD